ncbi:DinB family protein [Paenibacillus sp. GCM10027626]|uniref:DinB family protein n=1 Tax=Paenibacillus sp. GCM10027626 TaxID=3273411 RepID=UPI0036370F65
MNFNINEAIELLGRTPRTLEYFLSDLSEGWVQCNEGEGTWNAAEVIDHLIEAERTNWLPRLEHIIQVGTSKPFPPFDRYAHLNEQAERSFEQSLKEFISIREQNLTKLKTLIDPERHLELTGLHPEFGEVKLKELLATWAVHDLTHISQIVRVMAKRYQEDVGPWKAYLSILKN